MPKWICPLLSSATKKYKSVQLPCATVVWDIENVRLPTNSLSPSAVVAAIRKEFLVGYDCVSFVCCVTPRSLAAIEKQNSAFLKEMVPLVDIRVASARSSKLGADFVLKKVLSDFVEKHSCAAKKPHRIVLLTGDADFLESAQRATRLGFDIQIVHYGKTSSRSLIDQPYMNAPVEWSSFLERVATLHGCAHSRFPFKTPEYRVKTDKDRDEVGKERDEITKERVGVAKERVGVAKEQDEITKEQDEITKEQDEITKEQDEITKELDEITKERDEITKVRVEIAKERVEIAKERVEITKERVGRDRIANERDRVSKELGRVVMELVKAESLLDVQVSHTKKVERALRAMCVFGVAASLHRCVRFLLHKKTV
jgi:hypothetical protein